MCSDNSKQADRSRRDTKVDFEGDKQLLEYNNVVDMQLPKMHCRYITLL